jgi:HAD superfamily hydrolase (TIGR01509 family)
LEEKKALIGGSMESSGRVFERLLDQPGRAAELADELYALIVARVREHAEPLPGARELVSALRGRLPIAVASNSPRELLLTALERGGFADDFPVAVGADEVENPKPAPDLYLRACELLGIAPADAVALEDSVPGSSAARAAGVFVIGIPSLPDVELEADLLARSLRDASVWDRLGLER